MSYRQMAIVTAICAMFVAILAPANAAEAAEASSPVTIREINTEDFPEVQMTVSIDSEKEQTENTIAVTENGTLIDGLTVENLSDSGRQVDIVLVIDTSGSMAGTPMASATGAALQFVTKLPSDVRVGVVTFDDKPTTLERLTLEHDQVLQSLGKLKARGETSLYDGILAGTRLFSGDTQRNIIVLSDGADTVSKASLSAATEAAERAGTSLFTVGLTSGDFDESALQKLAKATGGTYSPAGTADLASVYKGLATELSNQYVLSYESDSPEGEVSLGVRVEDGTDSALFLAPAVEVETEPTRTLPETPQVDPQWTTKSTLMAGLFLAFMAILVFLVLMFGDKARAARDAELVRRTAALSRAPEVTPDHDRGFTAWMPDSLVSMAESMGNKKGWTEKLDHKLERGGVAMRPGEFMVALVLSGLGGALLGMLLIQNVMGAVMTFALAALAPYAWLAFRVKSRHNKMHGQLADILMILAGSLRAGHSFFESLDMVAKEVGEPGAEEFGRVVSEIRLGRSVDDALNALSERIGSEDFKWALLAVNIQRQVGGNLAEVLDTVADTIRERDAIRRQIDVLTAEGKLSVYILTGLPIGVALYMSWVNPEYLGLLFNSTIGFIMSGVACCMLAIGYMWMRKVVKIDV